MTRIEFRAILNLLMCSDPFPTALEDQLVITAWADKQAEEFGFTDWIDAYHVEVGL